jgi:hypothetical protein
MVRGLGWLVNTQKGQWSDFGNQAFLEYDGDSSLSDIVFSAKADIVASAGGKPSVLAD